MDCWKLIELLNEYEKSVTEIPVYWWQTNGMFQYWSYIQQVSVMYMISKHYGFIKWLVDNDKIDIDKYYEFMTNENIDISNACWELDMDKEFYYELLMILAVQDNSIEFLISVMK